MMHFPKFFKTLTCQVYCGRDDVTSFVGAYDSSGGVCAASLVLAGFGVPRVTTDTAFATKVIPLVLKKNKYHKIEHISSTIWLLYDTTNNTAISQIIQQYF